MQSPHPRRRILKRTSPVLLGGTNLADLALADAIADIDCSPTG